jgi:hypothetical protein
MKSANIIHSEHVALYECANLIEAHLLKGMLLQCDIDVVLHGEDLAGGMGELPAAGLLVLWVNKQHMAQAKSLIEEYEQQNSNEVFNEDDNQSDTIAVSLSDDLASISGGRFLA